MLDISFIMGFIESSLTLGFYGTNKENLFRKISKEYNELTTSNWFYQHLVIILRHQNKLAIIFIYVIILQNHLFDRNRFVLNQNYKFKIGELRQ